MNTPLRTLTQLHISLVVDPDIWKLLQNLKTIAGVIMENSSGMISNRFLELASDWLKTISSLKPFEEEEWAMEQLLLTLKLMLLEERLKAIRKFSVILYQSVDVGISGCDWLDLAADRFGNNILGQQKQKLGILKRKFWIWSLRILAVLKVDLLYMLSMPIFAKNKFL